MQGRFCMILRFLETLKSFIRNDSLILICLTPYSLHLDSAAGICNSGILLEFHSPSCTQKMSRRISCSEIGIYDRRSSHLIVQNYTREQPFNPSGIHDRSYFVSLDISLRKFLSNFYSVAQPSLIACSFPES